MEQQVGLAARLSCSNLAAYLAVGIYSSRQVSYLAAGYLAAGLSSNTACLASDLSYQQACVTAGHLAAGLFSSRPV
jgi:hypothetical protein